MKNLFFCLVAIAMFSFTDVNNVNEEDFGNCPFGSTEVVASCTSGCYQVVIGGISWPLNASEQEEAERRLQAWCDSRPLLQVSFTPPPVL